VHEVARSPSDVAHDSTEARHDVRQAIAVWLHGAQELGPRIDPARRGGSDLDAEDSAFVGRDPDPF
jgi:hypothetical protein